jgi:hypothetical protein
MKPRLEKSSEAISSKSRKLISVQPDQQQLIAMSAYFKAEARGFSPGHELDDWLEAERELAALEPQEEELAA